MFAETDRTSGISATFAVAVAVFTGALFVLAQPAAAQQGQQGAPPAQDIEVSDGELETFAEAHLEVQEIRQEMDQAIQSAEDREAAQAIQKQANQEMAAVIQDEHEMEVNRYRQIAQAINQDQELRQKFQTIIDELTEDEEGGNR